MFLLNGERGHRVDVSDRGFQYGDGVFETLEVDNGKPLFLQAHLTRLALGCRTLRIPEVDSALLSKEACALAEQSGCRSVLKLIVTRGSGGRGYRQPEPIHPTRLLALYPYPDYPDSYQAHGIVARFCRQRLAVNPALAGIKHMNRLEQVMARAEWSGDAIQEGLMLDYQDRVVEGTMSNLFLVKQGVLHTPTLAACGINGILRQMVLNFAARYNVDVVENNYSRESILDADELFVTNSVIGVWPIKQLEQQGFECGELTRKVQLWYAAARAAEVSA